MNTGDMDHDLRSRFAIQREAERAGGSPFVTLIERPASPRSGMAPFARAAIAITVLIAAAVGVSQARERAARQRAARQHAAGELMKALTTGFWRAPTDFLLEPPSSELTRSVPTFTVPMP